ncbi:MAG: porin, partial [Ectothiorhodospiraceae bacterium]
MSRTYLSALALAATLTTTGTAQAVDFEIDDSTTVGVFGTFEPKLITETNDVSDDGDPVNGEDQSDFTDEGSIVGFSVDHQVAPNLTVFGVAEFEYASIDGSDNSFEADATFAGFKGDFGKVQAGQFDGVYEDLIIDATEVLEDAEITDENAATEDNMIAYYSPDLNGFSFRGQVRFLGDGDSLSNQDSSELGFALAGGYTGENWGVYAG